jgi:hypothetical protein
MRLQLILPQVKPTVFTKPAVCPHEGCPGKHFEHHQGRESAKRHSLSVCVCAPVSLFAVQANLPGIP